MAEARRFEVWAPRPDVVELDLAGVRHPMRRDADGWWRSVGIAGCPGDRYGFVLDGGPCFPDPRSAWQPDGVFGRSAIIDHSAFEWTDDGFEPAPMAEAVIYELHVGTFTPSGRFAAVADHLEHLVDLGVTHLELMPVAAFSGEHGWGYDGVGLWSPHPAYGPPDDLRALVDAAHAAGIAVLLDVVYNHLGPEGNQLSAFGPYFTSHHRTPWGDAVNLDAAESDEVRRFVVDNACMWLRDYHADGLRLDAVHTFRDDSARHLLEQLASEVDRLEQDLDRPKVLIAESDRNDPRTVAGRPQGWGIDAMWADDLHHGLHVALTGERSSYYEDFHGLADVARALQRGLVYDGQFSIARSRAHGRPMGDFDLGPRPADRLVTCLENHDQIGNRALGERTNHLVPLDRYLAAATIALTAPGVPLLFQGEEWAASSPFLFFADHQGAELVEAVHAGRIEEFAAFGWDEGSVPDPEEPATFRSSKLDWSEVGDAEHRRALDHYRALLDLRRTWPDLRDGQFASEAEIDAPGTAIVFRRRNLAIGANLGEQVVRLVGSPVDAPLDILLTTGEVGSTGSGLDLAPGSAVVAIVGSDRVTFDRTPRITDVELAPGAAG